MAKMLTTSQAMVLRSLSTDAARTCTEVRDALGFSGAAAMNNVHTVLLALVESGYARQVSAPGSFRRYVRV